MKGTLFPTGRIVLLTLLLAASFPQAGLAGLTGTPLEGWGIPFVFRLSSTPLESSRGG